MVKSFTRLWLVALIVAWCFDFLFWSKQPGISFAIFIALVLLGGVGLSLLEKSPPARPSLFLFLPLFFFALMSFWRIEPFTTFVNYLLCLICLLILAITYRNGGWMHYSLADYAWRLLQLIGSAFRKPIQAWNQRQVPADPADPAEATPTDAKHVLRQQRKKFIPVLRGLLLALPVVLVFSVLLASADPIFAQGLEDFTQFLKIENLADNIFRLIYILVIGYFLTGLYLHALTTSREEKLLGLDKPLVSRFLGFTEGAIVLVSVDLLFAAFVGVQFRYFFGGQSNIHLEGYTYSEYARRGFSELVLVATFSLLLYLALSTVTRRISRGHRTAFSVLGAVLTILVGVILVSAYQRLLLYEAAYGFTRLRTYTHIFILWLGILLTVLMFLELSSKLRQFALAALLVAVGFGVTLNLLPVDGFIARQNILRAQAGAELDSAYLVSLSPDAVDDLWHMYNDPEMKNTVHEQIGGILTCQAVLTPQENSPWQSFTISRASAERLFQANQSLWERYHAYQDSTGEWNVTVNQNSLPCLSTTWTED